MYSNRFEHSHSRQYGVRSSRQWDTYDDRWEEKREPRREKQRDSHHEYGENGHSSTERRSSSREYSDSPERLCSRDILNRGRSRKSPVRRRMSSPDWGPSEKKRQRFADSDNDDYRYRHVPEDKASRHSQDTSSHAHASKDFKHTLPREDDFKYRKTPQDFRHRYRHEEFTYRQRPDDTSCKRSSGYYKDRDGNERSWDHSQERTRSRDCSTKSYEKLRERNGSPSMDDKDQRHYRTRLPLHTSSGQSFESYNTHQSAAVPEQKTPTKGFQRFLSVLNKGVNVATLTKIVTQVSTEMEDQRHSATSFMDTADRPWSSSSAWRQQESHQNTSHWSENERSQRLLSPQRHRSSSPKSTSLSDEKSQQRGDGERGHFSSNSRSGSPSVVEKTVPTPEDEHKHKHMQDVLQAIGMDLGFEELGQMSHRIQERLYGKKDCDRGRHRRGSRERDTRRVFSLRRQSRSSSSRSSFSPSAQDYYMKKDSYSAERSVTGIHEAHVYQSGEYRQNSSTSSLQENEKCVINAQENLEENNAVFSQTPTYTLSEPSPAPVMPVYSPVNCPPLPYPALPPNLPHVGPRLFLPHLAPFLPYPTVPSFNIFPAVLTQTRHILPQPISGPQPLLNLPVQPLNTTLKSKTVSRPRCLQVIETKQPG